MLSLENGPVSTNFVLSDMKPCSQKNDRVILVHLLFLVGDNNAVAQWIRGIGLDESIGHPILIQKRLITLINLPETRHATEA